ncbi:MAG: hypothetical protein CMO80_15485 [Verrucomicrobiales bacterium]|nr:hypothetical protein [Verrucomicrobiales bacterium]
MGKLVLWDMKDGWASKVIDAHVSKIKTRYSRKTGILGLDWHRDGRLVTVGRDRDQSEETSAN